MNTRLSLRLEFFGMYLLAPVLMAMAVQSGLVETRYIPLAFAILLILAIIILHHCPSFSWAHLREGDWIEDRQGLLLYLAFAVPSACLLTWWLAPHALFFMPSEEPLMWLGMLIFYPTLSVLPQGLIYRALFFSRYRPLFRSDHQAIAINAFCFGLAHLFYLNVVAVALTFIGGALFAWAHVMHRSFRFSLTLHIISGWILFTSGLGIVYFYHGAIQAGS